MAGEIPNLEVQVRTGTGKGAARQVRRDGMVLVVYGGGADPLAVQIPQNVLLKKLKAGRFLALFGLKVEGQEDIRVICRGVTSCGQRPSTPRSDALASHISGELVYSC